MAASNTRIDWALLLLRLAVGGLAWLQGFTAVHHAHGTLSLAQAGALVAALGEVICGALILFGIWVPLAGGLLAALVGWPLAQGWIHGAAPLGNSGGVFRLLVTLACAIGGGGRWALSR